ncbi:amino acid ABC transporter permease [Mesorhizobium sp. LNJC403B00]|uniref:amino acid ABC transporter permease n=1 Tax=Mesorhizobium sp. LNJC403B00 TaxID=1287280 RepID=UPI0032AFEBF6
MKKNLFSTPSSGALTICFVLLAAWLLHHFLSFAIFNAVWSGGHEACRANSQGACWPFIAEKFDYLRYGAYPVSERWRVDLAQAIGAILIVWLLWTKAPRRKVAALLFFLVYPVAAFVLVRGVAWLHLPVIDTTLWGGLLITLLMSIVGIVFSLPIGVILALGRRSELPFVKTVCVTFIEVVRGVPFITVLFMANFMMPLFVPDYLTPDRLLRPLIAIALFSSAYMAEVVRAGLQAIPKGQHEAAKALGIGYFDMMRLIVLPQALTIVIPSIVSTFIGLFKDTTLVAVVGIADFLKARRNGARRSELGRPDDLINRLPLCGAGLLELLLRHVALLAIYGAPIGAWPQILGGADDAASNARGKVTIKWLVQTRPHRRLGNDISRE